MKRRQLNIFIISLTLVKFSFSQVDFEQQLYKIERGDTADFSKSVYNKSGENIFNSNDPRSYFSQDHSAKNLEFKIKDTVQKFYYLMCLASIENKRKPQSIKGLKFLQKALQVAGLGDNKKLLFVAHEALGNYYLRNFNHEKALVQYNFARSNYTSKTSDPKYLNILLKICKVNGEVGNTETALSDFRKILHICNTVKDDKKTRGLAFIGIAGMEGRFGWFDSSAVYYKKGLSIFKDINDSVHAAKAIMGLSSLESVKGHKENRAGNKKSARKYFLKALDYLKEAEKLITPKSSDQETRWGILYFISSTYIDLDMLKEAKILNDRVYKEALEANNLGVSVDALRNMVDIMYGLKDYKQALLYNVRFWTMKDSFFTINRSRDIMIQTNNFEILQKLKEDSLRYVAGQQKLENEIKVTEAKDKVFYTIFISAFFITIMAVIFYVYSAKQKRQKEAMEYEKKMSHAKITTLLAQMNPHFVFNSLNSILSFIQASNKQEAIKYLSNFSKIIRQILEGSDKQIVSVNDEVILLRSYIELEQLRSNHLFDFNIIVSPSIDAYNTEIPFMMIQPFIENAIVHGIQNKIKIAHETNTGYRGELTIRYEQGENKIVCFVRDNGIGRQKSMELKQERLFEHESLGVKFTEERLLLLGNNNCKISYNDLYDTNTNESLGTEVIIELPILN